MTIAVIAGRKGACYRGRSPARLGARFAWRPSSRQARAGLAMLLLMPVALGCYRDVPVANPSSPAGIVMTVGITDRGRVALAPQLGPGVRRITGRLTESSDSALVLSVSSVQYLDAAQSARWSGEPVRVSREYVGELAERRISRTRSWLVAGAVALLAATAATLAITGVIGGGGNDKPGPGDPGDT